MVHMVPHCLQVFTTDQPRSRDFRKTFAPLYFVKKFYGLIACNWLFSEKNQRKNMLFSLVDARICKNNEEMFLLAGKTLETSNFISFYWLSLHFDSQSLQEIPIRCTHLVLYPVTSCLTSFYSDSIARIVPGSISIFQGQFVCSNAKNVIGKTFTQEACN